MPSLVYGGEASAYSCIRTGVLHWLHWPLANCWPSSPGCIRKGRWPPLLLKVNSCPLLIQQRKLDRWWVSFVASQLHRWRNAFDVNLSPDSSTGSCKLWTLSFLYFHWSIWNQGPLKPTSPCSLHTLCLWSFHTEHFFAQMRASFLLCYKAAKGRDTPLGPEPCRATGIDCTLCSCLLREYSRWLLPVLVSSVFVRE